ncbi:hypothetical protein V8E36_008056 [Tilletia maclaganii]
MAKGAANKAASSNASTLQILNLGFLISNAAQLLLRFGLFRRSASWKLGVLYAVAQAVALFLYVQLRGMAAQGINLAEQKGLTPYMFDIIYVTWFCSVAGALLTDKAWYFYLVIPGFAIFLLWTKLVVPYALGGNDPIRNLFSRSPSGSRPKQDASSTAAQPTEGPSKRQQKLQKRVDRGDPRVRQVQR